MERKSLLFSLHDKSAHPGVTSIGHYINSKSLPHTHENVKQVIAQCDTCRQFNPKFYKPSRPYYIIEDLKPFDRISIDLFDPKILLFESSNDFLFTVIDELSRFPYAFPIKDVTANTIIRCFSLLFDIMGYPGFIHSGCGEQIQGFLLRKRNCQIAYIAVPNVTMELSGRLLAAI